MEEPPKKHKFEILKCPFALRDEVIRKMEFMDAFHFSTLSKRSEQMVQSSKYPITSIILSFGDDSTNDHIEVELKDDQRFKISFPDSNVLTKRDPYRLDGRKLANLIDEPLDDYRKKLSAYLLFIFHSKWTSIYIERNIEHLTDLFLWDVRKRFDSLTVMALQVLKPEDLLIILNASKSK